MTAAPLTCPYCNAFVEVPPGAGPRLTCPRCGESFALRGAPAAAPKPVQTSTGVTETPPPVKPPDARARNRKTAAVVLGGMVFMATVGLAFALWTQAERRSHDTGIGRRPKRSPIPDDNPAVAGPVAPRNLAALRYLPPGSRLLVGVHLAELQRDKVGQRLLQGRLRVGRFEVPLDAVPHWVGLEPDEVHHCVLSLGLDGLVPRLIVVVRTRGPYNPQQVREKLHAEPVAGAGRTLYQFTVPGLGLSAHYLEADDRTLILAQSPADLAALPEAPAPDLGALSRELREVLQQRVEAAPLWAAGEVDDDLWKLASAFTGRVKKEQMTVLQGVRTFAAWVQPGDPVKVGAAIRCRDAFAARDLDVLLLGRRPWWTAVRPEAPPGLVSVQDDSWLTLQRRTDLDVVLRFLSPS
jgi:hypothetical protein